MTYRQPHAPQGDQQLGAAGEGVGHCQPEGPGRLHGPPHHLLVALDHVLHGVPDHLLSERLRHEARTLLEVGDGRGHGREALGEVRGRRGWGLCVVCGWVYV
jgi:hypothetical protein